MKLETSNFPVLCRLRIDDCVSVEKIIINGSSLNIFKLAGYLPCLRAVDVQTPSLRKCVLMELESFGNAVFIRKYRIPVFVVKGGNSNLRFVDRY
jgi:hypothetical protein